MNLSHTYSGHASQPKSYLGIGLVVALHLAGIYALSAGLIRPTVSPPPVTTLKPLAPDIVREPPPPEPLRVDKPILRDLQPMPIPMPEPINVANTPTDPLVGATTTTARDDAGPFVPSGPARPEATQPPVATKPDIRSAGAVCSVMPKPDLPALNWSGEAVLQVIATVRGGRVVGSDFRVAQGALDGKTRRSLQRSVESALAGYQCQGDAVFQQDFAFRLE